MTKLRVLKIQFEDPIHFNELRAFRSAIIEKAGRKHILFHNHLEENKYLYKYPKIQYKLSYQKPTILCINEGIEEIHHFFTKPSWDLMLYNRLYQVKVKKLEVHQFNMQVLENHLFNYHLHHWHALNQQNYHKYKQLVSEEEKLSMLEQILIGNILSFAKGINWIIEKEIKVKITNINHQKKIKVKNVPIVVYDIDFSTNVFLPNFIGLGKNVSLGLGIVKQLKKQQNNEQP